jgi:hypothetical protein
MRRLTEEAVLAGAFGFTTSRTNAHKTTQGARYVIRQETFAGTHGNGRDAPKAVIPEPRSHKAAR